METAICLVTKEPSRIWIEFLATFTKYDIYILIDNISFDTSIYEEKYKNICFIKIKDQECIDTGYIHSSYMPTSSLHFNEIIAWDRALYFFTQLNQYEHVWFFEDDCFFYGEETITKIDEKYPDPDILCRDKNPEPKEGEWGWFWPAITIHFPPPYFHSPICAVRMSKLLLFHINEYVKEHRKLFFIEALFPSIAHKHRLMYQTIEELQPLHWRRTWDLSEFNEKQIFHPMKDMMDQQKTRLSLE
jgi:hypothetical protein